MKRAFSHKKKCDAFSLWMDGLPLTKGSYSSTYSFLSSDSETSAITHMSVGPTLFLMASNVTKPGEKLYTSETSLSKVSYN